MITNFQLFGIEHLLALIIPIIIGVIFIYFANKYPQYKKTISIVLAILIFVIRAVRYIFDMKIGVFSILDLFSLHVCNIDLMLLIICLFKPNKKLFTFNFLIGIPTALAVALMPGKVHPDPGIIRAIFFIMSHMMLVIGSIYILITYRFKITKKDLIFYYIFSFIGMIIIYIFNVITASNYMYLIEAPPKTVLESMYSTFGPIFYVVSIYTLLVILLSILYIIYKLVFRINKNINVYNRTI